MKKAMRISLRAGERIYINGAVLRVDRKTTIELLNDVTFLLENQVMQLADAKTPLRQLYFVIQLMLIQPANVREGIDLFKQQHVAMLEAFENSEIIAGLKLSAELVGAGRYYEALKAIRTLFPTEDAIMAQAPAPASASVEATVEQHVEDPVETKPIRAA